MLKRRASLVLAVVWLAAPAHASERLCDPAFENCRVPLMTLIQNETVGIDAGFWFMEDNRYADALIAKFRSGVPVRLIVDTRANSSSPMNGTIIDKLAAAGIPIRRAGSLWLHWKMMLFAGQDVVEFSGANYSPNAFVPDAPYSQYIDEVIYFSDDIDIVNSFKTRFDDIWTSSSYVNYANVTALSRHYPRHAFDPDLNFVPLQNYATRLVPKYAAETRQIDIVMYRITDRRHTDALIAARQRGVRVRLLTEPLEYRNPNRLWHAWNIDRLHFGGVEIMHRAHQGLNHQKSVILHSQGLSVFGSSNWTSGSAGSSEEHNYFTVKPWIFDWLSAQFERKWNNTAGSVEYTAFVPLPPDPPRNPVPGLGTTGVGTSGVRLTWFGGPWAHLYDLYLDTNPTPTTLVARDIAEPFTKTATSTLSYTLPMTLMPGTTYYWRVVGKTMAMESRPSAVWSFTTAGVAQPPAPGTAEVALYASKAPLTVGAWRVEADSSAAGGSKLRHADANAPKLTAASATPANYFEMTFHAEARRGYRLWLRGRADSNNWANDSVFVQFSDAVTSGGMPTWRIGTTSAAEVNLEDCSGCGLAAWGWQDNGWGAGVLGPLVYFATTGPQTLRVQTREDGLAIDQIVLSHTAFVDRAPGLLKNDTVILTETDGSGGSPPPPPDPDADPTRDVVLYAWEGAALSGAWRVETDPSAAGGAKLRHPNAGAAKLASPLAAPVHYVELTFQAQAGRPYRLWLRGRADGDNWANDSVFVQFNGSVNAGGEPVWRIGTTSATEVNVEECSGCGLSAWGWQDNGWGAGVLGPAVYFEASGPQTIRVQTREDGVSVDQILLSPEAYLHSAPGLPRADTTILPRGSGG